MNGLSHSRADARILRPAGVLQGRVPLVTEKPRAEKEQGTRLFHFGHVFHGKLVQSQNPKKNSLRDCREV